MPTYRIETSHGTFDVESDREPTQEEALSAIGDHSSGESISKSSTNQDENLSDQYLSERNKPLLEKLAGTLKSIPETVGSQVGNIYQGVRTAAKEALSREDAGVRQSPLGALKDSAAIVGRGAQAAGNDILNMGNNELSSDAAFLQQHPVLSALGGSTAGARRLYDYIAPSLGIKASDAEVQDAVNRMKMQQAMQQVKQEDLAKSPSPEISGALPDAIQLALLGKGAPEAVGGTAEFLANKSGLNGLEGLAKKGVVNTAEALGDAVDRFKINRQALSSSENLKQQVAKDAADNIASNIPEVSGNVQDAALKAMNNGVEPRAIRKIANSSPQSRAVAAQMADDAKAYASGESDADPSLHVGNEVATRLEQGQKIVRNIGKQLGEEAKSIDPIFVQDAKNKILSRMQNNPNLQGVSLDAEGNLNFDNTNLNGPEDQSFRDSIQKNFDAVTGKSPEQLHKLRQSLFDSLGGKKGASIPLTDTYEQAIDSIRQGISDSLGPKYSQLSQQYAQAVKPLNYIKQLYKKLPDASEDILNEKGALLGRRLTQNAQSAPELRNAFNHLEDQIRANGGEINTSIGDLADFQHLLDDVYGIRKKGSHAGQIELGVRSALENGELPTSTGSLTGAVAGRLIKGVGKTIQKTDAVKQAVFENFMKSISDAN